MSSTKQTSIVNVLTLRRSASEKILDQGLSKGARIGYPSLMKVGTVALIIRLEQSCEQYSKTQTPMLLECLSDDREIGILESALQSGTENPLAIIYSLRDREKHEEEEFGNYVENLLSQPFLRKEIQEHAIQWLKSKIRIEQYQKSEAEATHVIAQYAFQLFQEDPARTDYFLAGPTAKVRIRIFTLKPSSATQAA